MEVKRLKIQFFRDIEDLTLELDPHITGWIGVNGLVGIPARPKEYQEKFQELFQLIEEGNLKNAPEKAAQLSAEIGANEADWVGARERFGRRKFWIDEADSLRVIL